MTEVGADLPYSPSDRPVNISVSSTEVDIPVSAPSPDQSMEKEKPTAHTTIEMQNGGAATHNSENKNESGASEPAVISASLESGEYNPLDKSNSAVTTVVVQSSESKGDDPQNGTVKQDLDDLAPADNLMTTRRDEAVRLRMTSSGPGADKPITAPSLLHSTFQRVPNNVAMAVKRGGTWVKWTYQQYYNDVKKAAKSFIRLGLEPYHGVGIIGFNSPEWFLSDLGAIFAGGFATGIYTTNSPEACEYVAKNCEANVIVVENNAQLQKILKVWDNLPNLKAVVQWSGEVAEKKANVYSWEEFMNLSSDVPDSKLEERLALLAPNKCCTLIYTSGTTGNPKGVMISHDNLIWTAGHAGRMQKLVYGQEVFVSYLPLSHIAAQMADIFIPIFFGASLYFCQPDALKGSLVDTLREVRPTAFLGVPRVWEKIQERLVQVGKQAGGFKRKVAAWAKGVGLKASYNRQNGQGNPFGYGLANALLFKKARLGLGLDRTKYCMSAAAPIMKDTLEFFYSLNIPVLEVYGMSECTGPHTVNTPERYWITSVGHVVPGVETKLHNEDAEGNGEICMNGRHVFMGYLNEPEKTKESIDDEGWLHSGDIGKMNEQGFYFITGRIKEILITAGGENIAPVPIEDAVKEELPIISNCLLIGDKRKFLSMLLTLKTEIDNNTLEPLDVLTKDAQEWCRSLGSNVTTVSDVIDKKDVAVLKAIQAGVDRANKRSTSRAQTVQKWSILPRDFAIPGGELGPTMKVRRPIVHKMYTKTIEAFYMEAE